MSQDILIKFAEKFNGPARLFFSPGRINLIGEHVDYNSGFVMPAAVDKGIWYAVAANDSDKINFYSFDVEEDYALSVYDELKPKDGWQNYVLGILDQVKKKGLPLGGFDCVFGGNLPVGAGMSSSAAVECGLLYALNEIFQFQLSRIDIAFMAQKAEHTFPGVMCGIMDQFASVMGKKDNVILLNCLTMDYEYFPLKLSNHSLFLINTKVHHSLASGEYNIRRQQCEEGFRILQNALPDIRSFQDIKPADVEQHKNELEGDIYRRCLFVTQEIERTQKAAAYLQENKLEEFGRLMYETHEGLSKLYDVSCPELDFLADHARQHKSILGSRVMGGGFGGCTINLAKKDGLQAITEQITQAYKKEFDIDAEVYEVTTGDGTYEM